MGGEGLKKFSPSEVSRFLKTKRSNFWIEEGKKRSLSLFRLAAKRVPAYRDFLKKNHIKPDKIKTWSDFQQLPLVSKKSYLRQYPLRDLCWDGTLQKPLTFTSTSGSTGEPFYFPRQLLLDEQYSTIIETFLRNGDMKKNLSTLVIVCFGMGVWIGGLITYKAFEIAANRMGAAVSVITPGINKQEIFKALKILAPHYDRVVLVGYPPFVKDIVDESLDQGVNLKKMSVRFLFAAEGFTETFRDYLTKHAGVRDPYQDILNVYGSADIGAMAYETDISIFVKRLAVRNRSLFSDLFSSIIKTPTLAQFNPLNIFFESVQGEVVLTGDNALPLIRYAIGDHGGFFSFDDLEKKLKNSKINFKSAASRVLKKGYSQLPFVYVYERNDFSTTIYGLQVYPETIREVLTREPFVSFLSGKLTMVTRFNKKQDQYIELNIELRKNKKMNAGWQRRLLGDINSNLRIKNSEFKELSNHLKNRLLLKLVVWPAEHPLHFKPGIKQKWVKR